jgi:hypothetical protein
LQHVQPASPQNDWNTFHLSGDFSARCRIISNRLDPAFGVSVNQKVRCVGFAVQVFP